MQRNSYALSIVLAALCGAFLAPPAESTMVEPLNFGQIVERAGRAFVGEVTAIEQLTTADGVPYTEYTFSVSESLKGDVGSTITIRQFGLGAPRPGSQGMFQIFKVPGMPMYKEGERVLLLVTAESSIGLTAPVGLFQGAFRLSRDATGTVLARNGSDNVNLFEGMAGIPPGLQRHRRGAVGLSVLTDLIERIGRSNRGRN